MSRPGWGTFAEGDEVIWSEQTRGTVIGLARNGLVIRVFEEGIEGRVVVKLADIRHANELVRFAREIAIDES